MATATKSNEVKATPAKREPVKLTERFKQQLNMAALRGKVSIDELQDLQAHITKVAGLIS